MIHVPRIQTDEKGQEIRPNSEWFKLAGKATKKAIAENKNHSANRNIYAHPEIKKALRELFNEKCAYCETLIIRHDMEVEHFRPKGRIHENSKHPGYYWLTYNWENLYPSCVWCNQIRHDSASWDTQNSEGKGGKADHFPLSHEKSRAMSHTKDISQEKTLLLDPCKDNPEIFFKYDPLGRILPKGNIQNQKKAKVSIDIFHLRASRLKDERGKVIEDVKSILELIKKHKNLNNIEVANDLRSFLDQLTSKNRAYLGVSRYVENNPEEFGI